MPTRPLPLALALLAAACASRAAAPTAPATPAEEPGLLVYTLSTGYVHKSTPTAAMAIGKAATEAGVTVDFKWHPSWFRPEILKRYRGVVLIATAGEPLGSPGTEAIQTLRAFVQAGGGLIGIENATNAHVSSPEFVALLGAVFNGHPGGVRTATCDKEGDHPSVARLPATITVTDEIYVFKDLRPDNQIVLRCGDEKVPVAWYRAEGSGRIFYSALGHNAEQWTEPPLVRDHVLPGILWAIGMGPAPRP